MQCTDIYLFLDDLLDRQIDSDRKQMLDTHLAECAPCRATVEKEKNLRKQLHALPSPQLAPARADYLIRQAIQQAHKQQRRQKRGIFRGWSVAAIAAGTAIWTVATLFVVTTTDHDSQMPGITIALSQPQSVDFAIKSKQALSEVLFTVRLPDGVELVGAENQSVVSWQGQLQPGGNLLSLPVIARSGLGGELETEVKYNGKRKIYRILVQVRTATPPVDISMQHSVNPENGADYG